ncbi:hypothetical protein AHAS_Ahas11G0122500 [Arachis hypogaea]
MNWASHHFAACTAKRSLRLAWEENAASKRVPVSHAIRNLLPIKFNPPDTFNEVAAAALALIGFQHVLRVGEMRGHSALLSALVERWRPETHTFHLPVGEVTVTLEDVSYILCLSINGEAVTGRSDNSHQFLVENCIAYFGRKPGPQDHVLGKVNIAWVWRCRDTEPYDTQESVERYHRLSRTKFHSDTELAIFRRSVAFTYDMRTTINQTRQIK